MGSLNFAPMLWLYPFSPSCYALGRITQNISRFPRPRPANNLRHLNTPTRFPASFQGAPGQTKNHPASARTMEAGRYGYTPSRSPVPQIAQRPARYRSPNRFRDGPMSDSEKPFEGIERITPQPHWMGRGTRSRRQGSGWRNSHMSPLVKRDEITVPTKESGGVPEPSAEYLLRASSPPVTLPHPQKILIVIDLNGTLLHRPNPMAPTIFIERPYARTFLSYCIRTFKVAIWSSARPDNVKKMLHQILPQELRQQCIAIWGRDKFGLSQDDYLRRVQVYKRLEILWNAPGIAETHPDAANGGRWNQENTVLVDDSEEKARSEPYNLLKIPEFDGDTNERGFVLPQVHDYLNKLSHQADISRYIRESSFWMNPRYTL